MAFTRKIILYQRYATKPVILTDISNTTKEDIEKQILEVFNSNKISVLETSNDILFIRPSELQSVLITKPNIENENSSIDTPPENEIIKKKSEKGYEKQLQLEKK